MSQTGSVRKRKDATAPLKAKESSPIAITTPIPAKAKDDELDRLIQANVGKGGAEWDYRIAITVITILAFVTRFWGISHPNEVVFDEVHFGKVRNAPPTQ